jgi:hypothetical protein
MYICIVNFYRGGILTLTNVILPALVLGKTLESLRACLLNFVVLIAKIKSYDVKPEETKTITKKEEIEQDLELDDKMKRLIMVTGSSYQLPQSKKRIIKENKYKVALSDKERDEKLNAEIKRRQINFITYYIALFNKLFLLDTIRSAVALIWVVLNLILALLIRPTIGNWMLFGSNTNSKKFEYLKKLREMYKKNKRFNDLIG